MKQGVERGSDFYFPTPTAKCGRKERRLFLEAVGTLVELFDQSEAIAGVLASPAAAQNVGLQNVLNGLASPTSAERFFKEGRQHFELEIRHLQQDYGTEDSAILKIDPVIFQHQQNLQQLE